jgi:hypothetical protein
MDEKAKQQFIEALKMMPSGTALQMHCIKTAGHPVQFLDLLVFGAVNPTESMSLQVADALEDLLHRPRFPLMFDESSLYTCPAHELEARAETLSNLQIEAMADYKDYIAEIAARLRPNALTDDALLRRLVDIYAGGKHADVRDVFAEGSDQKLATVALISNSEASLETWLTAALAIFRVPNPSQPPGIFEFPATNFA